MNKALFAFLVSLVPAALLHAQTLSPPEVVIPAEAAWTVDITYHDTAKADTGKAPTQPKRVRIEAARTGDVSRYRTTWSNGRITEDWTTEKFVLCQDASTGKIAVFLIGGSIASYDAFDQSVFNWMQAGGEKISRDTYLGKACIHVIKALGSAPASDGGAPALFSQQAWVDEKTHMPVAYNDMQALYAFTFQSPPTAPLVPPQQYQAVMDDFVKARTVPKRLGY